MLFEELIKLFLYVVQMRFRNARIEANEEGVVHDEVCVCQVPRNAIGDVQICGVAQKVAAEEVARFDAVGFQECGQVVAGKTGLIFHRDDITEPGGIGILRGHGKDEIGFVGFIEFIEFVEVIFSSGDELLEFLQLGAAYGRLHVRHLEVITNVAVNVFVIITSRQGAELLPEAFPASVAFATGAVTVPTPVTNGAGDPGQVVVIRGHAAAFPHCYMVSRIERKSRYMAKSSSQFR